jgi:hypothetical protein
MSNAPHRLYLNTIVGAKVMGSRDQGVPCPLMLGVQLNRDIQVRGSKAQGPGPGSPATTKSADPGDAVVVEENISLKFAEIAHLQSAANNTSEQGTQHGFLQVGRGRKCDVPQVYCGVEQGYAKHMALGPPNNAADDSSHGLFANSDSLDLDVLASGQFAVHHNRSAVPADLFGPSFLQEIFAVFCKTRDTYEQGQRNTITFTVILVLTRRRGRPGSDTVLAASVAGIVSHTTLPQIEQLKRLPILHPARIGVPFRKPQNGATWGELQR